jgi:hypothetical protein
MLASTIQQQLQTLKQRKTKKQSKPQLVEDDPHCEASTTTKTKHGI